MRTLTLIVGCLFAAPGWASAEQRDIRGLESHSYAPVIRASPLGDAGDRGLETQPTLPGPKAMQAWEVDYIDGRRTAKTGATMGWVGLAAMGTGALVIAAGIMTEMEPPEAIGELVIYGLLPAGFASTLFGAPIAAYGTIKSRRALVAGGQATGPCGNCVIAAVASVPNPFFLATVPLSYVMSAQQRRSDGVRYQRYTGLRAPRVNAGPGGVRLSWAF